MIYTYIPGLISNRSHEGLIVIRIPNEISHEINNLVADLLKKKLPKGYVEGLSKNEDESVITYSFIKVSSDELIKLQAELNNTEYPFSYNIYFNRPGSL